VRCVVHTAAVAPHSSREAIRALGERGELGPLDLLVDAVDEGALGEAAVGSGQHVLAPHDVGQPDEALGDEVGVLDDVGVVGDDTRDELLALRKRHVLPHPPLVLVAGVGLLHGVVAGVDLEDEPDGVAQRRVVGMGPVPAAPADVVADPLLGQAAQRVVERVDAELGPAAVVVVGLPARQHRVPLVHEDGVVDLEQEPGVDDRLVLLVQRVGEAVDERLLGLVVLVGQPVRAGRGHHRKEPLDVRMGLERRLEVGDVAIERSAVVGDRAGADPLDHLGDIVPARPVIAGGAVQRDVA
jgi:hypothetical protein